MLRMFVEPELDFEVDGTVAIPEKEDSDNKILLLQLED